MTQASTSPPSVSYTQKPNTTLLIVAVALGLVAAVLFVWRVESVRKSTAAKSFTVYMVTRTLEPGDDPTDKDVKAVRIPNEFAESYSGAIKPAEYDAWIGNDQRVRLQVNQGDVLMLSAFSGNQGTSRVALAPGKELLTIPVRRDTAPPVLSPDMYVNIYGSVTPKGGRPESFLVMEHVHVLVVGPRTSSQANTRSSRSYANVGVEVTHKESLLLNEIIRMLDDEEVTLTVRDPSDYKRTITGGSINPALLKRLDIKP